MLLYVVFIVESRGLPHVGLGVGLEPKVRPLGEGVLLRSLEVDFLRFLDGDFELFQGFGLGFAQHIPA